MSDLHERLMACAGLMPMTRAQMIDEAVRHNESCFLVMDVKAHFPEWLSIARTEQCYSDSAALICKAFRRIAEHEGYRIA